MFWNQLREYQTYEVQRTPYIEYINQFISNLQEQKKKNQQLLYFQHTIKVFKYCKLSHYTAWLLCIIFLVLYTLVCGGEFVVFEKFKLASLDE